MPNIIFSKGSGLNDSLYGKSQEPIYALIEQGVEAFQEMSLVDKMFTMIDSKNFAEKFTYMTPLGNFEVTGEGGTYPETSMQEGYDKVIEPYTWKQKFEVTQEMVEDDKMGTIKRLSSGFTLAYNRTRETYAAAMIMGGITGSTTFGRQTFGCKSADGVNLFSTGHTSKTGVAGNQSNLFATDFSYDALCVAQEKMQKMTDDDGNLLNISPDTIMIPNDGLLKKAVFTAIGAEGLPDTTNHSFNFQFGLWNIIINPYLNAYAPSGKKPWLLLDTKYNDANYGPVWVDRVPLSIASEISPINDNNIWKGRCRFGAGFNDWRGICVSYTGSGGTALTT